MAERWKPAKFQLRAVKHLVERATAGLFLKPGMRKTSINLAAFKILQKQKIIKAAIVLAPLRVIYTSWPSEVKKWADFNHLSVGICHGSKKDEIFDEPHDLYLVNYEGISWLVERLIETPIRKWPADMLIADESDKLKNFSGKRFKLLKPLLKFFKRRIINTGTPMGNHLLDVFAQAYIMDLGATFGPYITHFQKGHFYPTGFEGYGWAPKDGTETMIHARLAPRVYYADEKDWLDLPPIIQKDIHVDLPPQARQVYEQMETLLRLDFENGRVTAANSGVATMKCRQIANGGVYLDSAEKTWKQIHEAKTDAVEELLEELGGAPSLITYDFRHDLERLHRRLGKDIPYIGRGGVNPKKMPELIARWNAGEIDKIIVSAQSMAHGVDGLQEAGRAVIWHSLTYNFTDYDQLIARLRRSGQRERVLVAHIIAHDTVDHALYATVKRKAETQGNFFLALKQYWTTK